MKRTAFLAPLMVLLAADCVSKKPPAKYEPPDATKPYQGDGTPAPAMPGVNVAAIKVDTVGYPVGWQKLAIFNVEPQGAVIKDENGKVVHTIDPGKVKAKGKDEASQDPVWQVDFSEFDVPGRYLIENGDAKSEPFAIGPKLYAKALEASLKSFYFQRTRTALEKPYAVWEGDEFVREGVSHVHENVGWDMKYYPEKLPKHKWKPEAGWHDAGNYDIYVPSEGPSVMALLMSFEAKPDLFGDKHTNIPESGNSIPDILDEAKWGLRWILSMQEKQTGALRVRETVMTQGEVGNTPPDEDKTVRWVDDVGSASTAKGCAVAAMAARVYKDHDQAFAKENEKAAHAAWAWVQKHPDRVMPKLQGDARNNPWLVWDDGPKIESDLGARFMCAVEMWRSFRLPDALEVVRKLVKDPITEAKTYLDGEWANLSRWGMIELAFDEQSPKDLRKEAKTRLLAAADMMRKRVEETDGYRCAHELKDYVWASNSALMEKAHIMYVAYELDPEGHAWARQAARDQWHWIMGRNPNGYSMVTHVGKGPTAFYHAEWGPIASETGKVPPGYMVGGPNANPEKGAGCPFLAPGAPAKALLWDNPRKLSATIPAHTMWHWEQRDLWLGGFIPLDTWDIGWWAVTENDVYYNATLTIMATYVQES